MFFSLLRFERAFNLTISTPARSAFNPHVSSHHVNNPFMQAVSRSMPRSSELSIRRGVFATRRTFRPLFCATAAAWTYVTSSTKSLEMPKWRSLGRKRRRPSPRLVSSIAYIVLPYRALGFSFRKPVNSLVWPRTVPWYRAARSSMPNRGRRVLAEFEQPVPRPSHLRNHRSNRASDVIHI